MPIGLIFLIFLIAAVLGPEVNQKEPILGAIYLVLGFFACYGFVSIITSLSDMVWKHVYEESKEKGGMKYEEFKKYTESDQDK